MAPDLQTISAWSYGLAGVGYALFALQLGLGWRGGVRGLALLAAVGLSAAWGLLTLAFALWQAAPALILAGVFDVLRSGAWYAFLLILLLRPQGGSAAGGAPLGRGMVPLAALLTAAGLVSHALAAAGVELVGEPDRLTLFLALAMAVLGLVLVEQLFRNVPPDARWNVKPLCLGLAVAYAFDLYLYADALLFRHLDADAFSVRGFVHALVIPLAALSAVRNRDWTFRIALSRRVVFHSTALVATGTYLLFMAGAGYYVRFFGGDWGRALQVALLVASLLFLGLLVLSGSMRARLRVLVNKHFFSYRYDYREEWLRFTKALASGDGEADTEVLVVKGLADMVESPAGSLWLRDASGRYTQGARWNMAASPATEAADGPLARFLARTGWVLNLEEFRSAPARYDDLELPRWLGELPNAWLVVPLISASEPIGFVILATARTPLEVNWEVTDLLKTAGRQAASFLGQMRATEALLESRKFDAFNRMSAFVVHDLKNIVAQLSLMLRNAERHRDNPEFQRDMLMTVEHSVERMKQLMLQLREGATPVDAPRGVDLAQVIRRIGRNKAGQEPVPELELEERVTARGHEDRLERVIGHIVQNAIDATDRGGRVWITLSRHEQQAQVEIGDTGHGMTPEFMRERLFKPFQSTKKAGMGIGAYESFQYVQELGGRVLVDSTPGSGTRVRILLPLLDADAQPGVQEQAA